MKSCVISAQKTRLLSSSRLFFLVALTAASLTIPQATTAAEKAAHKIKYVAMPSLHKSPLSVNGRYIRPAKSSSENPAPAVLVLHGSGGSTLREESYQNALADAGIASLAIDGWTARDIRSAKERPETVMETLPDAYGARKWLMAQPEIDGSNIGVMGFSWGGVASMLASTTEYNKLNAHDGTGFQAALPIYPVCWIYNKVPGYTFKNLSGIPVHIVTGGADEYDMDADACPALHKSLPATDQKAVSVEVLQGAHHNYDSPRDDRVVNDSYARRGKGGPVLLQYNKKAAERSIRTTVTFFQQHLNK